MFSPLKVILNCKSGVVALAVMIFLSFGNLITMAPATAYHGSVDSDQIKKNAEIEPKMCEAKFEQGTRITRSGTVQSYSVYYPDVQGDDSASVVHGPFPTVLLIHGFLMTGSQHKNNAQYLAEHGFIVLCPNISKWLWGEDKRLRNIDDLVDSLDWLRGKTGTLPESIRGKVDSSRIGVGGNSSGGAAALEVALKCQKSGSPIQALVSLDGVPWDRTADLLPNMLPVKFLTLRAEDCLCNYHARMVKFLEVLKFPYDDVKVIGARHCDVENPTTFGCYTVCGKSDGEHRMVFQSLLYLFLRDSLGAPKIGSSAKSFKDVVHEMESQKRVVVHSEVSPHLTASTVGSKK